MAIDVVTGAEGFIGSALVRELLARGRGVVGIGIDGETLAKVSDSPGYEAIVARFEEYSMLPTLVKRDVDVFYHCAWAGGFTSAISNYGLQMGNAVAAGDALVAAASMGCRRFVQSGTYNEFEIATLLDTDCPCYRPTSVYSAAKTAADVLCRTLAETRDIEYSTGLIPMPYGEGNRSMQLVNVVLCKLLRGESPALVKGDSPYDLVYVSDIAKGLACIGEHGKNRRGYYIGHRKLRTFREWMEDLRDVVAPGVALAFGEYPDNQSIDWSRVDTEALHEDTGFECLEPFDESVLRTARWVARHLL